MFLHYKSILVILFLTFVYKGNSIEVTKNGRGESRLSPKEDRVFVIQAPLKDLAQFKELAKIAEKLKPYGSVEINISELAEKGFHEIPPGRNFWYEYASYNPTIFKFFPDSKIAPFIPEDFVKRNRDLLLSKAKILREYGLGAAFWSYEPNFITLDFFEKYPGMLGPRVDHPRRGNYPAFAPCIDSEETQEIYVTMAANLLKSVPEIHTFFFKTNDAGSGICWSGWQYTGANGPLHCKDKSMGERIETLMNTFKKGAEKANTDISLYLTASMFSDEEKKDIYKHLPDGCYYQSHNSDEVKGLSSMIVSNYPVKGMFDPVAAIHNINSLKNNPAKTVFISFRSSYDRDHESFEAIEKFVDLLVYNLSRFNEKELVNEKQQLEQLCLNWGGKANSSLLFESFTKLSKAIEYRSDSLKGVSALYCGVSERYITRPLVFAPQLLSKEDESYFLPYVFNPSEEEARMDFTDVHGIHQSFEKESIDYYVSMVNKVSQILDKVTEDAPERDFIRKLTLALRIHGSIFRSIGNFNEAQAIRDRNSDILSAPIHRPDKTPNWEGDADMQVFNTVMRDELDNTAELIDILENGGLEMISHANDPKLEDTFLLGPDLIEQLRLKRKIMLKHWNDIEGYLTSPFR